MPKLKDAPDTKEPKEPKGPTEYEEAYDAQEIGNELVELYHPHLKGLKIRYLYRSTDVRDRGRTVSETYAEELGVLAASGHLAALMPPGGKR